METYSVKTKLLTCRDFHIDAIAECTYYAEGETVLEAVERLVNHGELEHPEIFLQFTEPEKAELRTNLQLLIEEDDDSDEDDEEEDEEERERKKRKKEQEEGGLDDGEERELEVEYTTP